MDYEFKKNTLDGSYHAWFSMGHEVMGRWLLENVGESIEVIIEIKDNIDNIKKVEKEWRFYGETMTLILNNQEVLIQENSLLEEENAESNLEISEGMFLYNDESVSVCGLEDFSVMLESWKDFIHSF